MRQRVGFILLVLLLGLLAPLPGYSQESPRGYLERIFAEIRQVLEREQSPEDKSKALRSMFFDRVDLKEISRQTLGGYWGTVPEGMQNGFVSLFGEHLAQRFIDEIGGIRNVQLIFTSEEVTADNARVMGKIKKKDGSETPIQFSLIHSSESGWKVSGAEVEGINLMANFRSQFRRIIKLSSFEELLARIKGKFLENSKDKK